MSANQQAILTVVRNLPEAEQCATVIRMQPHFSADDLIQVAWHEASPGVLRGLSRHEDSNVRIAVARNAATPMDILEELADGEPSSVASAAKRNLMWRALEQDAAEVPPCTPELIDEVAALVRDRRWHDHAPLGAALEKLLSDPDWNQNARVMRLFYNEGDLNDPSIVEAVGASSLMRILLSALEDNQKAEAVQRIAEAATPDALLHAIQSNEDTLKELTRRLARRRARRRRNDLECDGDYEYDDEYDDWEEDRNGYRNPLEWVRVGYSQCPSSVLFNALSDKSDDVGALALAHVRSRPDLRGEVTRLIAEKQGVGADLWLAAALPEDALLDLPFQPLMEDPLYTDDDDAAQIARMQFTAELRAITAERPEAWQTLFVLSNDYHGSAREMLAALRNL